MYKITFPGQKAITHSIRIKNLLNKFWKTTIEKEEAQE